MKNNNTGLSTDMAGLLTMGFRLVIGWTYFSAFWRRLILENKLIPEEAGYIGIKFNHFLPNALGIKPVIEYLVSNPEVLQAAMVAFTIVEAIVGLFVILGLFTRLAGIGVFSLAMGILLGSGWIGTTCLDEWQIGVLGVAGGFTLFLTGSGYYSLDYFMKKKGLSITRKKWFPWLGSGLLPLERMKPFILVFSLALLGLTLFTNQVFHGGVWGTLHNKSVKPKVEISNIQKNGSELQFEVYRVEGVDVYGSFLIGIQVLDPDGKAVIDLGQKELSSFPVQNIHNHYVAKVAPGVHSLILPLGAKADLSIDVSSLPDLKNHTLKLTDISGIEWITVIE